MTAARRPATPISAERWQAIDGIFAEAADRSGAERSAYLAQACGSDTDLRAEVESLLAAHDGDADFLEAPHSAALESPGSDLAEQLQKALGSAFRVERELVGGGMSRVFVAEEIRLGRPVVVKVLPPELRAGLSIERFHQETRLAASLRHPHIVPVMAAGESADGLVYFTMPFIKGESLEHRLEREGRLPLDDVVGLVREIADALAYAHANGVVHRDVKPGNVLIDGGHAVVADFGVAKAIELASSQLDRPEHPAGTTDVPASLTMAGGVIGTPAYMSPEQARAEHVDARTDVYSLGCMTFEMLTGQRPFPDYGIHAIALRNTSPAPCAVCSDLPPALDVVLARALAPEPDDRFQSTTAFAQALGAAAVPAPSVVGTPTVMPVRPAWRRPWVIAATVLALTASVSAVVVFARRAATGVVTGSAMPAPISGPSLAVLPFESIGTADDAYFAEGVSDGLVGRLTSVSGVRVMSPRSTRQYRDTDKPRDQIGRELGVDYLLDGRVRWSGADTTARRVRVTVELVRARDGSSVWADDYEMKSQDVLDVEGRIGAGVIKALEVALGAREQKTISGHPTENFEAYTYYLRGESFRMAVEDAVNSTPRAIEMFERAVALDPKFALAFARLARAHLDLYWSNTDRTSKRLALVTSNVETALRLDPNLPQAHIVLANYYFSVNHDYDRAFAAVAVAEKALPGSVDIFSVRATVLRRMGRLTESIANFERAMELDPRSAGHPFNIANILGAQRKFADAVRYIDRTIAVNPRWAGVYADRAMFIIGATGDVEAARRSLRDGLALPDAGKIIDRLRFKSSLLVGYTARDSAVIRGLTPEFFRGDTAQLQLWTAYDARRQAQPTRTRAYADSARVTLERRVAADPREAFMRMQLAIAYALLDRKADALREAARAAEILPPNKDTNDGVDLQDDYVFVEALTGETDAAVKRLAFLLTLPSDVSVNVLRVDPRWDAIRGTAAFQRLIR